MKFLTMKDQHETLSLSCDYLKKVFSGLSLYKAAVLIHVHTNNGQETFKLVFDNEENAQSMYDDLMVKFQLLLSE